MLYMYLHAYILYLVPMWCYYSATTVFYPGFHICFAGASRLCLKKNIRRSSILDTLKPTTKNSHLVLADVTSTSSDSNEDSNPKDITTITISDSDTSVVAERSIEDWDQQVGNGPNSEGETETSNNFKGHKYLLSNNSNIISRYVNDTHGKVDSFNSDLFDYTAKKESSYYSDKDKNNSNISFDICNTKTKDDANDSFDLLICDSLEDRIKKKLASSEKGKFTSPPPKSNADNNTSFRNYKQRTKV